MSITMPELNNDELDSLLEKFANSHKMQNKEVIINILDNEETGLDCTLIDDLCTWFLAASA